MALVTPSGEFLFWLAASAAVGLLAWLSVRDTLAALLVWMVARPFVDPWFRFPADRSLLTFDRMVISVLLIALLWRERKGPWKEWFSHSFEWLYCAFLILTAANLTLLSAFPLHALRTWTDGLVLPFAIYLLARETLQSEAARHRALIALLMLSLLLGVMGVTEQLFHIDWFRVGSSIRLAVDGSPWLRVNGPYRFTETFGLVSVLLFAFLLFHVRTSYRHRRGLSVLLMTSLALLAVTAVFTFFRLFALLVLLSLGIWILLMGGKQVRRAAGGLAAAAFLIAVLLGSRIAGSALYKNRVADLSNVYARLATLKAGWQITQAHWLQGVGFVNFPRVISQQPPVTVHGVGAVVYPHNSYVQFAAELGVIGLLLYLATLGLAAASLARSYWSQRSQGLPGDTELGVLWVLAAYAASCFVVAMATDPDSNMVFFFLVGLGVAAARGSGRAALEAQSRSTR
jgi:O-antigen ligase